MKSTFKIHCSEHECSWPTNMADQQSVNVTSSTTSCNPIVLCWMRMIVSWPVNNPKRHLSRHAQSVSFFWHAEKRFILNQLLKLSHIHSYSSPSTGILRRATTSQYWLDSSVGRALRYREARALWVGFRIDGFGSKTKLDHRSFFSLGRYVNRFFHWNYFFFRTHKWIVLFARADWLARRLISAKYYSPPSSRRKTKWIFSAYCHK